MNIHYFRDGYCHRVRCRNMNSARFAAVAARGKVAKEQQGKGGGGCARHYFTLQSTQSRASAVLN